MSEAPQKISTDGRIDKLSLVLDRARCEARCDRKLEAMVADRELPPDDVDKAATCMAEGCKSIAVAGGYCIGHAAGRHAHTNRVLAEQRREFQDGRSRA